MEHQHNITEETYVKGKCTWPKYREETYTDGEVCVTTHYKGIEYSAKGMSEESAKNSLVEQLNRVQKGKPISFGKCVVGLLIAIVGHSFFTTKESEGPMQRTPEQEQKDLARWANEHPGQVHAIVEKALSGAKGYDEYGDHKTGPLP